MKKIELSIRPYRVEAVIAELCREGVPGVTATEVRELRRGVSEHIAYRGVEQEIDLLPRMKLEIVLHDDLVERIVARLLDPAPGARANRDEISILPVVAAVRIRTGEIDEAAL